MSISNLLVPNNFDLFSKSVTSSGVITASSFSGDLVPLGPVEFPSTLDSNAYNDFTSSVSMHGGCSINKKCNAKQVFINSTNNSAFVPDSTCDNLVIVNASGGGLQINTDSTSQGQVCFGDSTGNIQGGFIYQHNNGTTDSLSQIVPGAQNILVADPVTPHYDISSMLKVDKIGELNPFNSVQMLDRVVFNNSSLYSTVSLPTTQALGTLVVGDMVDRFGLYFDGEMFWGNGVNPSDTKLSRVSPAVLAITDQNDGSANLFVDAIRPSTFNNNLIIQGNGLGHVEIANGATFDNGTIGYTPSLLNYYEEFNYSATVSGPVPNTGMQIYLTRFGKRVNCYLSGIKVAGNSVSTTISITAFPARFNPIGTGPGSPGISVVTWGYDNGGTSIVLWQMLGTGGTMTVYKLTAGVASNFTLSAGATGFDAFSVSWVTA